MDVKPQPCFLCGKLPVVDDFALMTGKRAWTAMCPNKHYETAPYYIKEGAIEDWNRWCDNEGYVDNEDLDDWDDSEDWRDNVPWTL